MKKSVNITIVILLLISFFFNTYAQDLSLFEKREYISGTDTLRYRILFPENYDKTKKYPLLLFLHGAGERGRDNETQLTHGMKLFVQPEIRKDYPVIVVAPQCPLDQSWNTGKADRNVKPIVRAYDYNAPIATPLKLAIELTNQVIKTEAVQKDNVVIAGLSMGGMGTFEAVGRYPKLFRAAAPICGGGDTKFYRKAHSKVKYWVFHGDADDVVDVKYSREMVARLKELKADVKYTEYPGVNHGSWTNAFAEAELPKWLFKK